jgi:peptidoglycan LD-endopeptidase CwlK
VTYVLGARSLANLKGVDPALIAVAERAIQISEQDFGFTEPQVRTLAEEEAKVASGASHTLKSHHLVQANGYGGACDAVPWDGAKFVWEWPRIFLVARAFQMAFAELKTEGTWGGVWDKLMSEYGDPQAAEAAYVARMKAAGHARVFVDGPHFELGRN